MRTKEKSLYQFVVDFRLQNQNFYALDEERIPPVAASEDGEDVKSQSDVSEVDQIALKALGAHNKTAEEGAADKLNKRRPWSQAEKNYVYSVVQPLFDNKQKIDWETLASEGREMVRNRTASAWRGIWNKELRPDHKIADCTKNECDRLKTLLKLRKYREGNGFDNQKLAEVLHTTPRGIRAIMLEIRKI